ncbi:MAG: serine hydrolase [Minisyncoccia bacterium]
MKENLQLSQKIKEIVENFHPKPNEISLAIIDLKNPEAQIAGFNMDHFIYPASIYKVFVGAEILRQINAGLRKLEDVVEITLVNEVDKNVRFFPKCTHKDYRPLLKTGDKVTTDYLLDLMLTRSDNTASNVLIDIANRENINNNIILPNGWNGSDVTRKFLDRLKEEGEYRVSKITVSNARHLAEFFYKVEQGQLVNPWVSEKLKSYLLRWNRDRRGGLNLKDFKSYYRKGGWLVINGYKWNIYHGIRTAFNKGYAVIKYSGDAGVVEGKNSHYAIAVLTITKTKWPWQEFSLKKLSREIYDLMESKKN